MGPADKIIEKIRSLPEEKQAEVFEFVDFLQRKLEDQEKREWSQFSLGSAVRGMEDEESIYSLNDLKENFS